jgi:hypothetical protein
MREIRLSGSESGFGPMSISTESVSVNSKLCSLHGEPIFQPFVLSSVLRSFISGTGVPITYRKFNLFNPANRELRPLDI